MARSIRLKDIPKLGKAVEDFINMKLEVKWNFVTTEGLEKFEEVFRHFVYGCSNTVNSTLINVMENAYGGMSKYGFSRSKATEASYRAQGYEGFENAMRKRGTTINALNKLLEKSSGEGNWEAVEGNKTETASASKKVKVASKDYKAPDEHEVGYLRMKGSSSFTMTGYPLRYDPPLESAVYFELIKDYKSWIKQAWEEALMKRHYQYGSANPEGRTVGKKFVTYKGKRAKIPERWKKTTPLTQAQKLLTRGVGGFKDVKSSPRTGASYPKQTPEEKAAESLKKFRYKIRQKSLASVKNVRNFPPKDEAIESPALDYDVYHKHKPKKARWKSGK